MTYYEFVEVEWQTKLKDSTNSIAFIQHILKDKNTIVVDCETEKQIDSDEFFSVATYNLENGQFQYSREVWVIKFKPIAAHYSALTETIGAIGLDDTFLDKWFFDVIKNNGHNTNQLILVYKILAYAYKFGDEENDYEYEYHHFLQGALDNSVKPPLEYEVKHDAN